MDYRMLPNPVDSIPPLPLQPIANSKWNYVDPQNLTNGGIYSAEDVEKLNEHICPSRKSGHTKWPNTRSVRKNLCGEHHPDT